MTIESPNSPQDEADVLAALQRDSRRTSAAHDEAVLAAARRVAAERARRARRARRVPRWYMAGASVAAVALVAIGLVTLLPQPDPSPGTVRGVDAEISPANDARLAEPPAELSWPAQRGAANYRVVLRDAAARPLWSSRSQTSPRLELPGEAREALSGEGTYLWTVEVENGARREIGPYWFHVRSAE